MSNAIPLRRSSGISYEIVKLTPQDARRLLDRNTHNRPIIDSDVMKLASEMEAGRWQMNGEAIKIAEDGTILDGQHRLTGLSLLRDGTAIEFLLIRGLPAESQKTMDQGRKRSAADQMNLSGINADKTLAAAARVYIVWVEGLLFTDNKAVSAEVTTPRIVEWSVENAEVMELLRRATPFRAIPAVRPSLSGAVYARLAEVNATADVDEFFQKLKDGIGLPEGSPLVALRNRLVRHASTRVKIADRDVIGMLVRTFNDWMSGRTYSKLQLPSGGRFTVENFPAVRAF